MREIRQAPFALRVIQRHSGKAAVVYRRMGDEQHRDRFHRVAALSPLGLTAALPLVREAVRKSARQSGMANSNVSTGNGNGLALEPGPFYPLNADWGARLACFGLIAAGLRDAERITRAAAHLRRADATEAAWWFGMLIREDNLRALRALRILTEAVV